MRKWIWVVSVLLATGCAAAPSTRTEVRPLAQQAPGDLKRDQQACDQWAETQKPRQQLAYAACMIAKGYAAGPLAGFTLSQPASVSAAGDAAALVGQLQECWEEADARPISAEALIRHGRRRAKDLVIAKYFPACVERHGLVAMPWEPKLRKGEPAASPR
jgi:hypothetical protein